MQNGLKEIILIPEAVLTLTFGEVEWAHYTLQRWGFDYFKYLHKNHKYDLCKISNEWIEINKSPLLKVQKCESWTSHKQNTARHVTKVIYNML